MLITEKEPADFDDLLWVDGHGRRHAAPFISDHCPLCTTKYRPGLTKTQRRALEVASVRPINSYNPRSRYTPARADETHFYVTVVNKLREAGFIESVSTSIPPAGFQFYGYRITDTGRAALGGVA